MTKRKNVDDLINEFNEIFKGKYIYTKINYINNKTKIEVICPKHGIFYVRPIDHLHGNGCPECANVKKMTEHSFIEKANKVHNNFFKYENCGFTNVSSKVKIICPIHGEFWQKANNHLNGQNCPKCSKEKIKHEILLTKQKKHSTKKLTMQDFINKVKEKNIDFDFSECQYKNFKTKVKVICHKQDDENHEHGAFYITPNHLLNGRGCPKCGKNIQLTTEVFIDRVKNKFPLKEYSFEQTKYESYHKKVGIICNKKNSKGEKHGLFYITPANLLNGKEGCPICKESLLEQEVALFLRNEKIEYEYQYKTDFLKRFSLDFYLPKLKVAIECQGIQHFQIVDFFGGVENFKKTQKRDEMKRKLCKEHDIRLIYFTHENESIWLYPCINNINDLKKIINNDFNKE